MSKARIIFVIATTVLWVSNSNSEHLHQQNPTNHDDDGSLAIRKDHSGVMDDNILQHETGDKMAPSNSTLNRRKNKKKRWPRLGKSVRRLTRPPNQNVILSGSKGAYEDLSSFSIVELLTELKKRLDKTEPVTRKTQMWDEYLSHMDKIEKPTRKPPRCVDYHENLVELRTGKLQNKRNGTNSWSLEFNML